MCKKQQLAQKSIHYLTLFLILVLVLSLIFAWLSINDSKLDDLTSNDPLETEQATQATIKPVTMGRKPASAQAAQTTMLNKTDDADKKAYVFSKSKIESLAARKHYDERSPLLNPSQERELPSAKQLQDPSLYLAYEAQYEQKFYQAYRQAAKLKLQALNDFMRVNRDQLSEEQKRIVYQKQQALNEVDHRFEGLIE